jgi:hypothetical protein
VNSIGCPGKLGPNTSSRRKNKGFLSVISIAKLIKSLSPSANAAVDIALIPAEYISPGINASGFSGSEEEWCQTKPVPIHQASIHRGMGGVR